MTRPSPYTLIPAHLHPAYVIASSSNIRRSRVSRITFPTDSASTMTSLIDQVSRLLQDDIGPQTFKMSRKPGVATTTPAGTLIRGS